MTCRPKGLTPPHVWLPRALSHIWLSPLWHSDDATLRKVVDVVEIVFNGLPVLNAQHDGVLASAFVLQQLLGRGG